MTAKFITENSEYTDFRKFDSEIYKWLDFIIFSPLYNGASSCANIVIDILTDDVEDFHDRFSDIGFDCEFDSL